jgi:hypothetical protein
VVAEMSCHAAVLLLLITLALVFALSMDEE